MDEEAIRLNKAMANLGICSRREADRIIESGRVFINNSKVTEIGIKVSEGDKIKIGDKEYIFTRKKKTRVWLYYKPVGLVTTHQDEKGRPTVFDDVSSKISERVISVGRLDLNSEGLLILTNDSEFARMAESPKNKWERRYKVRVFGNLTKSIIKTLGKGITINGINYAPIIVNVLRKSNGKNHWVECTLTEGKNREIRKVFNHFGIAVNKLIRIQYGPYALENMQQGEIKETTKITFK